MRRSMTVGAGVLLVGSTEMLTTACAPAKPGYMFAISGPWRMQS